jgi:hypothetical protein
MTLVRRILLVLLGLVLLAAGLLFFTLMCGSNAHVAGALLGGIGAILIGIRRKAARVTWGAMAGATVLALAGTGMEYLSSASCAGIFNALGAGVCVGAGLGLMVDGVRRRGRP